MQPAITVPVSAPKKSFFNSDLLLTVLIIVVLVVVLFSLSRTLSLQRRVRDLELQPPVDDIMMKGVVSEQMKSTVDKLRAEIHSRLTSKSREVDPPVLPAETTALPTTALPTPASYPVYNPTYTPTYTSTASFVPTVEEVHQEVEEGEVLPELHSLPEVAQASEETVQLPEKKRAKKRNDTKAALE